MKTLLPTFFLLLIFSLPAICQTSLTGKVTDGETGEELIASNVTVYKNGVLITGAAADFDGNYSIDVDPGTYDLEISYVGYSPSRYNGVIARAGQINVLDVSLGGTARNLLHWNNRKTKRKKGVEFQSPNEEGAIKEVLDNEPRADTIKESYPMALVNFSDFKNLVSEIETYRKQRLVSLDSFLRMSKEANTIILDTRAKHRYDRKHIKGAKHLAFTEFTQYNLNRQIRDKNTRILIYCNNNFTGDQIDFASKTTSPSRKNDGELLPHRKPIMLALNIPTYLNLYAYGFKNVYELNELVDVGDLRIEFEGTQVFKPLTLRKRSKLKTK